MRLDVWLDVACLCKTRSEAKRACEGGKIDVNGQGAKPHRELKEGDEIEISRPFGRKQKVIVRVLAEQHMPKAQARRAWLLQCNKRPAGKARRWAFPSPAATWTAQCSHASCHLSGWGAPNRRKGDFAVRPRSPESRHGNSISGSARPSILWRRRL